MEVRHLYLRGFQIEIKQRLTTDVGDINSFSNFALNNCHDLLNTKQSLIVAFDKQADRTKKNYRMHLTPSIYADTWLLHQEYPFRG